ncbi:hypothetical protein GALMADRAFT_250092 [Galerina marginata CBS 339.88]|uniref:Uncharacterized protein n=1 Tax=Galerina marginata (strain CBS 339.88) TaxID=685588 RepID=A0A067SW53_GALM3|nr:hypothetical protein GALMADRAFT_250092 [Galerina marginata CBS 339.88]
MDGHGEAEGHGQGHESGEPDGDPDTHMGDNDDESRMIALARAAAEAKLSDAAAQALGLGSSHADAQHGLDNINHNVDPGTFLPPADGSGAGGSSSSGGGGSVDVDEALNTYMENFIAELDNDIPGDGTAETEARRLAAAREAYRWYRDLENKDPVTDDIDSIDGYLRDYRIFDNEAQMARNALRLDLTAADRANARTSAVVTALSSAGRSATEMGPQTEHVLEISIVAHMINSPTFVQNVNEDLGPNYMALNNFTPIETLAQLASALKQNPNLVGRVPKWFNDLKGRFFQGKTLLDPRVAAYLEESSAIQGPWIRGLAANHTNPYVSFVFNDLAHTRFAKGGWDQLIGTYWWVPISESGAPAI